MVECNEPTEHYPSGCKLLLHYDADNDGRIVADDASRATRDYFDGLLSKDEAKFVVDCYNQAGVINDMCPNCYTLRVEEIPWHSYLLASAAIIVPVAIIGYDKLKK